MDIACRHSKNSSGSKASGLDEVISRQLAAAEASQKQAEKVSKQLVEAQQQILKKSRAIASGASNPKPEEQQTLGNRAAKTDKSWQNKH